MGFFKHTKNFFFVATDCNVCFPVQYVLMYFLAHGPSMTLVQFFTDILKFGIDFMPGNMGLKWNDIHLLKKKIPIYRFFLKSRYFSDPPLPRKIYDWKLSHKAFLIESIVFFRFSYISWVFTISPENIHFFFFYKISIQRWSHGFRSWINWLQNLSDTTNNMMAKNLLPQIIQGRPLIDDNSLGLYVYWIYQLFFKKKYLLLKTAVENTSKNVNPALFSRSSLCQNEFHSTFKDTTWQVKSYGNVCKTSRIGNFASFMMLLLKWNLKEYFVLKSI